MATATTTGKAKCFVCGKEKVVYLCEGCSQKFCFTHLNEYRQNNDEEFDKTITECDWFQQKLIEQKGDQNQRSLIQQVDKWAEDSIMKIKLTAEECKKFLFESTNDNIIEIEKELKEFIHELERIRQENDFNEIHLNQLRNKLNKLEKKFDESSNISIQRYSTSFIKKISIS
ncbi:unnamed protein product, partial [Rotaria sp. Silwood2]